MTEIASPLALILAGLILGLSHALEADHVAAVSTLATQKTGFKDLLKLGAFWGLGHTASIMAVGLMVLIFKVRLPDNFAPILESLVGVMLIFLGVRLFKKIYREKIHAHLHRHNGATHIHFHSHSKNPTHKHQHRSFIIGLIHGLAGSAALVLLVLATIDQITTGVLYLLIFGIGSIIGMAIVSSLIGLPVKILANYNQVTKTIQLAAASFSILIGSTIIITFAQSI